MGCGSITGFNGLLQVVTTNNSNNSWIYTVYNSLWHALNILNLLCLHQSTGNGLQLRMFPSSGFPNCPCAPAAAILSYLRKKYYSPEKTHSRLNLSTPIKKVSSQTGLKSPLVYYSLLITTLWQRPPENIICSFIVSV
jgi:hypothetical protein